MDINKTAGHNIKILSNLFKRHSNAPTDFGGNGHILGFIYKSEGQRAYQRDIEQAFSIRRSTVTAILQRMEKNGLVTRTICPDDNRLRVVSLTDKAREIFDVINTNICNTEKRAVKDIEKSDLETFFKVLCQMRKNLEEGLND